MEVDVLLFYNNANVGRKMSLIHMTGHQFNPRRGSKRKIYRIDEKLLSQAKNYIQGVKKEILFPYAYLILKAMRVLEALFVNLRLA